MLSITTQYTCQLCQNFK